MIIPQITIPQWLSVPGRIREKLKVIFNIPKSSGSMVEDGKVVSDGHTHDDLLRISVEAMQKYLGSTEVELYTLFNQVIEKLEQEVKEEDEADLKLKEEQEALQVEQYQKEVIDAVKNVSELAEVVVKRRGRPVKKD